MKKQLLILITLMACFFGFNSHAQTLLPGDIVVIGIGADTGNPAPNTRTEFSWVPLVNLTQGTQFYFTDAGWNTASNEFMGTGLNDEILLRFTVPTGGILAGRVQIVSENGTDSNYTVISGTKCGNDTDGKLTLPNAGDSIIVFKSTATIDANFPGTNFTALFAATTNTTDWASMITTTAGTATAFRDNYSNLPPGLTNGVNAVAVGLGPGQSDEADNARYEGSTSGSRAAILSRVCSLAQWKRYDVGITSPIAYPADAPDFNGSTPVLGWTANGVSIFDVAGADITPPVVQSITLNASPAANSSSVTYTVTFNENANNISTDDFQITTSGGVSGSVSNVSASSGTSVTVTVGSISGTGTLRLDLKSNTNITDTTGNGNNTNGYVGSYTSGNVHSVDRDSPTVVISSSASNPTNLNPIPVTFTFSENVTGFDSSDVTVTGGSIGTVTGTGNSYAANITPSGDGTITVNVASSRAVDAANNGNIAATQLSRTSDRTAPTITSMNASVSNPSNANSFTLTINFSESVNNFALGDISITNAGLGSFSGSGSSYTVTVTPSSDGVVTASIGGSVANDNAGNNNIASSQFSITIDRSQPSVSISSTTTAVTNSNPIPVTVAFNEPVFNFALNDIVISNGTPNNFTVNSASNYSFTISPSGNGVVTVNIAASVANDAAGNNNTIASQLSRTYDNVSPNVVMSTLASNPTNANSFSLAITFSESVTNFAFGDITASNANLSDFSGSGANYSVTVTPIGNGTVTVNIASNVANDQAGNGNNSASQFSIVADRSRPSPTITSSIPAGVTNTSPIPITIAFNEAVFNFTELDISVGNGNISGFTANSTSSYSFNITPISNGTVTVNVASDVANDAAGNTNTAATQFSKVFDNTSPTISLSSVTPSQTNATSIPVTVTFSESVTGFEETDITVGNGSISNFSGSGANYSFTLLPASPGTVTVSIVGGIAVDAAGNGNSAATQFSRIYDNSQPNVSISSITSSPTNSNSIPVTFTFNESVTGFDATDVSVTNGLISGFSGSGASYSATLNPNASGTVSLNVASGVAFDSAGNGNTSATQFSIVYDNTRPSVSITSLTTSPTNAASFTVNFTFSETVNNFESGDISVGNGSLSNFNGSGASYSATITPTSNGTVTINVSENVATDIAGNTNYAATQFSIVSDKTSPSLSITTTATNPTNINSIPLTFTFSESVTGFDNSDITILGGNKSDFSGSGSVYTVNVTAPSDGTITIFVFSNSAVDSAGNPNDFASFSITSDKTKPTVTISSTEGNQTSANPIPISFNFSEPTSNFVVTDVTVTGGTLQNLSGSGANYTASLIPSGTGNKTVRLNANVMSDAAGNTNNASAIFTIYYLPLCSQTTTWNGFFWTNGNPVATQPAVIAADYESSQVNPGGFSACSLIIGNNANVVISPEDAITISGQVMVLAGSTLKFKSGSNLIQTGTTNNNSGNIVYERETIFRRLDYTFWSSPVAGQNLKQFSPQTVSPPVGASRFYTIDETTNGFVAVDPVATNFTAAKGFMIRTPNDFTNTPAPWTGTFTGVPNNGNITIAAQVTNIGSNLIGNPYPSTINADSFLATNPGTLYLWTHDNNSAQPVGAYATYTTLGATEGVNGELFNGYIQAGQGFVYQPSASTTVSFTNSMREANSENQFFRTSANKHRLWLNLNNQAGLLNQILIGYIQGATEGTDISLDGKSRAIGSSISSVINNENYAIQARSFPFADSDIVPLSFKAENDGNYSLSLDHFDGLFADQNIYLKDNLTGILHDLKQSAYNFSTVAGEFANRFSIVYQSTLGIKNPVIDQNSIIVYNDNGTLKINSGSALMSTVKVFDIRGRLLYDKNDINSSMTSLLGLDTTNQLLIVQVTANNSTVTKKVVY